MEEELEDYSRDNRELQRLMELQRQKLDATTKEMKKEQQQVHDLKVEIGNFKAGLHSTSQHIQEPKQLKEAVKALYRKYLRDHEQVIVTVHVLCNREFSIVCAQYSRVANLNTLN